MERDMELMKTHVLAKRIFPDYKTIYNKYNEYIYSLHLRRRRIKQARSKIEQQ